MNTEIIRPIRQIIQPLIHRVMPPNFLLTDLFSGGQQGTWYDASDLSLLFQNSTGTTPVASIGDRVGLLLDKSNGLMLGSELITNGTFDTDTTGWTAGQSNGIASISVVDGALRVTTNVNSNNGWGYQAVSTTPGKVYGVTVTYLGGTATARFRIATAASLNDLLNVTPPIGNLSYSFTATTATSYIKAVSVSYDRYCDWDNISVRELPDNYAIQNTVASRPTLAFETGKVCLSGGSINWIAPAGTYTIAYLGGSGPVILEGQALSGATNVMLSTKMYEYIAVPRALSSNERVQLLDYFYSK